MVRQFAGALLASLFSVSALAQVSVDQAWVRATVPAQKTSGAFMQLNAAAPMRLVGIETAVAGRAELHEMAMQGDVMRMRQVASIELPAGKVVQLAPGGHHVMLFDLKRQLKQGEPVVLTLVLEDANGRRQRQEVTASVAALGARVAATGHEGHAQGHAH